MDDSISRQAAIDAMLRLEQEDIDAYGVKIPEGFDADPAVEALKALPPAHPEMDEWCTDCKEYDSEKHCCPRFNRVIREALAERKTGRWVRHYTRPNVFADLYWHCSVCGYKNDNQYANRYHKYCPNCGALMEGVDGK